MYKFPNSVYDKNLFTLKVLSRKTSFIISFIIFTFYFTIFLYNCIFFLYSNTMDYTLTTKNYFSIFNTEFIIDNLSLLFLMLTTMLIPITFIVHYYPVYFNYMEESKKTANKLFALNYIYRINYLSALKTLKDSVRIPNFIVKNIDSLYQDHLRSSSKLKKKSRIDFEIELHKSFKELNPSFEYTWIKLSSSIFKTISYIILNHVLQTLSKFQASLLFLINILILEVILFIFFTTKDLFIFFITFECSIIPLAFIIGRYGSGINRIKATYYFFFFPIISSISLILALFYIWSHFGTTNLDYLLTVHINEESQKILFFLIFIPLAAKVPMYPFHAWLPEAHVESPTEGSVLLAGLLLKLGIYGIIRFLFPLVPLGVQFFTPLVLIISLGGIISTSFLIFRQLDFKKIIAYSSIIHMNFALLGLFSGTVEGILGSIYLSYTHGIVSSGLFIAVGCLYLRSKTRIIYNYKGLMMYNPLFGLLFFILILGNFSFPGTGGFIGEVLILFSIFQENFFIGICSIISSFFCAIFSMLLYSRLMLGSPINLIKSEYKNDNQTVSLKLTFVEYLILTFFGILTIITGLMPTLYLNNLNYNACLLNILLKNIII